MPVKQRIKAATASLLRRWDTSGAAGRVVVLCYHSIHPHKSFASATPEQFRKHLQWLREHCSFVRFAEVAKACRRTEIRRPAVAVTFDDGYADNYEYAFPILQECGITATFFLTVGLLGMEPGVLQRFQMLRQSSCEDVRPMTWPQVREMRAAGMDAGAHTCSHANLRIMDRASVRGELTRSKEVMEQRLGERVGWMAYPFGKPRLHFTKETQDLAAEAGYEGAAAVLFRAVRAADSPLAIPRFFVARDTVETLAEKIYGAWDFLGWWQENVPLNLARVFSPRDFIH